MRILAVVVALVICAASASSPKQRTIEKTTNVIASYDDTWAAVTAVAADRQWAVVTSDKAAGTITTDWMAHADKAQADCGVHALASKDRDPKFRVTVRVQKAGPTSTVVVDAAFQRIRMFDDAGRQIDCTSKGTLEADVFTDITTKLKVLALEREKAAEEAAKAAFYCVSTWCSRFEAECETRRAELVKAATDAPACVKAQKAACFIGTNEEGVQVESCHTTPLTCIAQRTQVTTPPAKLRDVGECAE